MPLAAEATGLPAILAANADRAGESVWLLYPRGADWRWLSWRQVADQVASAAAALEPAAGGRCGFVAASHPDGVAAGLAILAAGRVAVALEPPLAASCDSVLLTERQGREQIPEQLARYVLPPPRSRLEAWTTSSLPTAAARGVIELAVATSVRQDALMAAAAVLSTELRLTARRPILASAEPLTGVGGWLLLAASLLAAMPWVLSPRREELVGDVRWTRPMVVAASAEERRQLLAETPESRSRWNRLEVMITTDGATGEEEAEDWARRGVRLLALPSLA